MKEKLKKYAKKSVPIIFILLVLVSVYKCFSGVCYVEHNVPRKCIDKFHTSDKNGNNVAYYVNFMGGDGKVHTEHVIADVYYKYEINRKYIFVEADLIECEE